MPSDSEKLSTYMKILNSDIHSIFSQDCLEVQHPDWTGLMSQSLMEDLDAKEPICFIISLLTMMDQSRLLFIGMVTTS